MSNLQTVLKTSMKRIVLAPAWIFLISTAAILVSVVPAGSRVAFSADDAAEAQETLPNPLVVINVASVERLLTDMDYMFAAAERPELSEAAGGALSNVNDLKGLARDKPFGLMLFLRPGLPPQPVPIGFLPVKSIDDLLKTASLGPLVAKKVEGKAGRYELVGPNRTFHARLQSGYAFVGQTADLLDREFPDPVQFTKRMTAAYDIAVRLDLKTLPRGFKDVFLNFLKIRSAAELQRRDDEPEARFRLRKARGDSDMQFMEQLLTQADDITLGIDASEEKKTAALEFVINAAEDSEFATYLKEIGGKHSHFAGLFEHKAALTLSASWVMAEREKKLLNEALDVAETAVSERLGREDEKDGPIQSLFGALNETAKRGHVDFVAQFVGKMEDKFALVGGLKIANADAAGTALTQILQRLQDNPDVANLKLNVDTHNGVAIHRIEGKTIRPQDERLYGGHPGLFVGAGSNAIWFAVGGDKALPELKKSMDTVAKTSDRTADRNPDAPFQLNANFNNWLGFDPNAGRRGEIAKKAFSPGGDAIQVDFRPTDKGARLRIEMQEGFVRMVGYAIAGQFDRRQERRQRRERDKPQQ